MVSIKADTISDRPARAAHSSEREVGTQALECTGDVKDRQIEE